MFSQTGNKLYCLVMGTRLRTFAESFFLGMKATLDSSLLYYKVSQISISHRLTGQFEYMLTFR